MWVISWAVFNFDMKSWSHKIGCYSIYLFLESNKKLNCESINTWRLLIWHLFNCCQHFSMVTCWIRSNCCSLDKQYPFKTISASGLRCKSASFPIILVKKIKLALTSIGSISSIPVLVYIELMKWILDLIFH